MLRIITLSVMTLGITIKNATLSTMSPSITIPSITALCMKTHRITTLSIMPFSIMTLIAKLCYAERHKGECHIFYYVDRHYSERCYVESHGAHAYPRKRILTTTFAEKKIQSNFYFFHSNASSMLVRQIFAKKFRS